mgnify:FL=1
MDLFWKTLGAALISGILTMVLDRQSRDYSIMVTVAACGMMAIVAAKFLSPVLDYLGKLETLGDLRSDMLLELLKIFGIGMSGEMAATVCIDAGNSSLGKGIRFLSNAAILYLSIPIYASLTGLLVQILGDV